MRSLVLAVVIAASSHVVVAQGIPQLIPFQRTGDLFVTDATDDNIWRLQDLNLDGDYNDAGEIIEFYSDSIGTIPLTNNVGCAVGPDGTLYVCDSSEEIVLALLDLNGDGDANDIGEHFVWFDGSAAGTYGGNGSGVFLTSPQDLTVDAQGVVWVATANNGSGGNDAVVRLQDFGGGAGANDAGEAVEYYTFPAAATGDHNPADVKVFGGFVYVVENGTAGKGVYRLHDDVIPNGNCNDPGEVTPFFIPPTLGATPFHWGLAVDGTGVFYLNDTGNDILWRFVDVVPDFNIDPLTEASQWWTSPGASLIWRPEVSDDGRVFVVESQTPDRVLVISDTVLPNGTANDPGEVIEVYDENLAAAAIGNPRSLCFAKSPALLIDSMPSIGTSINITVDARATDLLSLWFSTGAVSFAAPPFGVLGISVFSPDAFGELLSVSISPSGVFTLPVTVPNVNALIGQSFTLQGLCGPLARLELTNPVTVTFQP